jgi:sugar/nucleoside kinase (ribokinase family)
VDANARIVCVGVVTVDTLALLDRYPGPDERVEARQVEIAEGGPAANAAVVLARQGHEVAFVGRVGDDEAGRQAIRLLNDEGVDTTGVVVRREHPTQASCILIDQGARTRAICTLAVDPWAALEPEQAVTVDGADWIHTDHLGFLPVARRLAERRSRPIVSIDAGNDVRGLDLSLVDLYVPTAESLRSRYRTGDLEEAARCALDDGAGAVVATDGRRGSHAWWTPRSRVGVGSPEGHVSRSSVDLSEIVSTLGAGDVFHGAIVAALLRHCSWEEALDDANATAALSCRALDGRSAVPGLSELHRMMARSSSADTDGEPR